MLFPDYRGRRMRQSKAFRRMVRETRLSADDLIFPLFAVDGKGVKNPIPSMPGQYQMSIDNLVKECREAFVLGIPAVILFGLPEQKDALGRQMTQQVFLRQCVGGPRDRGREYHCCPAGHVTSQARHLGESVMEEKSHAGDQDDQPQPLATGKPFAKHEHPTEQQ